MVRKNIESTGDQTEHSHANDKLEFFTDHVITRLIVRGAIIVGTPIMIWLGTGVLEQINQNHRAITANSRILSLQEQSLAVTATALATVVSEQRELTVALRALNDRLIRLEVIEQERPKRGNITPR
jgi:hypothetical protein